MVTMDDVRFAAQALFVSPGDVEFWISAPNKLLDSWSPAELIEKGEGDRVLALLDAIAVGAIL